MTATLETVRHEAADLYRFVEPLVRMCADLRDDYPVYTKPSRSFFQHIEKLGKETQSFLQRFPSIALEHSQTANSKRQKLLTLRTAWESLHEYVRPALDADTLHLPTPLVTALEDRINQLPDCEKIQFTLFLAMKANYLQVPSGVAREVANDIADLVGGTRFPPYLGLVGIPYSQATGFFLNCLLPHEMGHFVYQEVLAADVETEIDHALEGMEEEIGTLDQEDISLCRDTLKAWIEEVFCDLFAICLIGPAFSFAFAELTAASLMLGHSEGDPADFYFFMQDHPCEVARFHSHVCLLKKIGWWEQIKGWDSPPVQVLIRCEQRSPHLHIQWSLPSRVGENRLLQCYWEVCEWLLDYLPEHVKTSPAEIAAFGSQSPIISEYLRRAVVPSTIISNGTARHPTPVVLINSIFRFYLEELTVLLDNINGEDKNSVQSRSKITERLELWALKALEDYRLLTRQVS